MPLSTSWPGFPALQSLLARLANPDPQPILERLEEVIRQDNYRGVLAGLDCDGRPMPLTWRQKTPALSARLGDGPPLAPHRDGSRAITNLRTSFFMDGPGQWVVIGAWEDVVSKSGTPFLPFHFRGEGRLPTRNLAGLRPDGLREAFFAVDLWARSLLND